MDLKVLCNKYKPVVMVKVVVREKGTNNLRIYCMSIPTRNLCVKTVVATTFQSSEVVQRKDEYDAIQDNAIMRVSFTLTIEPSQNQAYDLEYQMFTPDNLLYYKNLLNHGHRSDVTVCIEGKQIFAHQMILSAKSSVFHGLFASRLTNSDESYWINISNVSYRTLYDVLHFMYTGELIDDNMSTDNLFSRYSMLLQADNLYCVNGLKDECERVLLNQITSTNLIDCLLLADSTNSVTLKKHVINTIVENAQLEELHNLLSVENLKKVHPEVLAEIVKAFVYKQQKP